jgi:hypothetical protein
MDNRKYRIHYEPRALLLTYTIHFLKSRVKSLLTHAIRIYILQTMRTESLKITHI